jgi:predicted CxxxxCH...CXXCH cytochrome family protein
VPSWDGTRCTNVYCHGTATPSWTLGTSQAECGTCHAIPPANSAHAGATALDQCTRCHPRTIDATGALIAGGGHINGVVDVAP